MTVKELIEELEKCPKNKDVVVYLNYKDYTQFDNPIDAVAHFGPNGEDDVVRLTV